MSKLDLKSVLIGVIISIVVIVVVYLIDIHISSVISGQYFSLIGYDTVTIEAAGSSGIMFSIILLIGVISFWAYLILNKLKK
jgi:hypothetical protein